MTGKGSTTPGDDAQERIAKEIEAVFERFYRGKSAYSKGQLHDSEFFLRSDYALVVLNRRQEIRISFADHTRPSYAALFALLLDEIQGTDLCICEDYETDEAGSMVFKEIDGSSTGAIIWDEKERYFSMLKSKVKKVMVRKSKRKGEGDGQGS